MKKKLAAVVIGMSMAAAAFGMNASADEGGKLLFFAIGNLGDMGINDLGWYAAQNVADKNGLVLTVVEGTHDASVRTTSFFAALGTGGND